jgi:ABC-type uncharacterized transport system ATPase subunit
VKEGRIIADESLDVMRERARRRVTIAFTADRDASSLERPACLALQTRKPNRWRGELTGDAKTLLQWAASQPIADIEIERPDLEQLFRRYYEAGEGRA